MASRDFSTMPSNDHFVEYGGYSAKPKYSKVKLLLAFQRNYFGLVNPKQFTVNGI